MSMFTSKSCRLSCLCLFPCLCLWLLSKAISICFVSSYNWSDPKLAHYKDSMTVEGEGFLKEMAHQLNETFTYCMVKGNLLPCHTLLTQVKSDAGTQTNTLQDQKWTILKIISFSNINSPRWNGMKSFKKPIWLKYFASWWSHNFMYIILTFIQDYLDIFSWYIFIWSVICVRVPPTTCCVQQTCVPEVRELEHGH